MPREAAAKSGVELKPPVRDEEEHALLDFQSSGASLVRSETAVAAVGAALWREPRSRSYLRGRRAENCFLERSVSRAQRFIEQPFVYLSLVGCTPSSFSETS